MGKKRETKDPFEASCSFPALRATKTFGYRQGGADFFVYLLGKEVKNKGSEGWARLNERTGSGVFLSAG